MNGRNLHRNRSRLTLLPTAVAAIAAVAMLAASSISGPTFAEAATKATTTPTNGCGNPVLASDLQGWGSLDDGAVSREAVTGAGDADWAFGTSGAAFYMPQ